jgi:DNA-binding transcriptional ArsR family regulator
MESLTALADPTRRKILEMLGRGERAAGDIAESFAISGPAISQHLKVLRDAKLVTVRVDGQRRIYSLDPAGLDEIDGWLTSVRRFWTGRLGALEHALRETPTKRRRKS